MIWGGSFLLLFAILCILSLLQFLILKRSFRKNLPQFPLPGFSNCGESLSLNLEVFIPFLLPGFRCLWKTVLHWEEGKRSMNSIALLQRGHKIYHVLFSRTLRGVYSGISGVVYLEDLFGFLRFVLYQGEPVSVKIYPGVDANGFNKDQIISGGETATAEKRRVRSDELLEVRKYYPGDDARRINWKMFAATGQLYLRIGEDTPPPSGEVILVLNSFSSLIQRSHYSSDYTDVLINAFITFIYSFVDKGYRIKIAVPALKDLISFDPAKPDELLRALSSVTCGDSLKSIPECDFIYVFSHPLSETLKYIGEKNSRILKVFIKELPSLNWKKVYKTILFSEIDRRGISFRELKFLKYVEGAAERDVAYLKKIGKGKIHGEII